MYERQIRVGTGIILLNDKGQFLMGKRKGSHREGTWALVGGYIEFGETFEEAAEREALEETGLTIHDFKVLTAVPYFFDDGTKHHITIYCIARIGSQIPKLMEPDKNEGWQFFDDWNDLPTPNFVPYNRDVKTEWIMDYWVKTS
jgi:8-oxo-dGTP diphosphatase